MGYLLQRGGLCSGGGLVAAQEDLGVFCGEDEGDGHGALVVNDLRVLTKRRV